MRNQIEYWANKNDYIYYYGKNGHITLTKNVNINNREYCADLIIMHSPHGYTDCLVNSANKIHSFKQLKFYKKCLFKVKHDMKKLIKILQKGEQDE